MEFYGDMGWVEFSTVASNSILFKKFNWIFKFKLVLVSHDMR